MVSLLDLKDVENSVKNNESSIKNNESSIKKIENSMKNRKIGDINENINLASMIISNISFNLQTIFFKLCNYS